MTIEATGICWESVQRDLEHAEWEAADGGGYERKVFIGTVFQLFPSGKYYMPWACSNLDKCEECKGTGKTRRPRQRRLYKKLGSARRKLSRLTLKLELRGKPVELLKHSWYRYYLNSRKRFDQLEWARTCQHCGGMGSREAHLDDQFSELLEQEADQHGLSLTSGEGDPCDIFAVEYRDEAPESEDNEE